MGYTFKVLKPKKNKNEFNKILNTKNAIFLAGPCPRGNDEWDWRNDAFDYLNKKDFDGVVITPTNKFYDEDNKDELATQTYWEHEAMCKSSAIVFWIDRSEEHPGYTTNIEFGEWFENPRAIIGMPTKAIKNNYLKERCKIIGKKYYSTLEATLDAALKSIGFGSSDGTSYFTSDTHFSQQRTLELSRRPFLNIEDMDLRMISNWNKTVTMNDDVFHAGDLGDLDKIRDIINCLNFRTLTIVPGNYERRDIENFKKSVRGLRGVTVEEKGFGFTEQGQNFYIVHEPLGLLVGEAEKKFGKDNFCILFGHIHGRNFAKRNGMEIGTDYHKYTPISLDDVVWYNVARTKYWDENVFSNMCINQEYLGE